MTCLASCDSDALGCILDYVSGGSILRLVMCGSPALSAKLFAGCRKLNLAWDGLAPSRWPSLICQFRQLTQFVYGNDGYTQYLPCSGVNIEQLPYTLKELTLSYYNPVLTLFNSSYTSLVNYPVQFPHLHTLRLYSKVTLAPFAFAQFPASLTHLDVRFEDPFDACAMLSYMPRGLKSLAMGTIAACDEEEKWNVFPQNLESLELAFDSQSACWVKHLPASLTSLEFDIYGGGREEYVQNWPFLPRQLKRLRFGGVAEPFDLNMFKQLPPSLESLSWSFDMQPSSVDYENCFLDSLLKFSPSSLKDCDFNDCGHLGLPFCAKMLEPCAWRCKQANLRNVSDFSEKWLPALSMGVFSRLSKLTISKGPLSVEAVEALPTTIDKLTIKDVTNSVAIAIGKRLVSLHQLSCPTGSLSVSGSSGLPRNLHSLWLGHAVLETLECLKELPKHLKVLTFDTQRPDDGISAPVIGMIEDPRASYLLPETLTKLSLHVPNRLTEDWFKGLAQHPSLDDLTVTFSMLLPSSVLLHLPKRLRQLNMSVDRLDANALKMLPRSLRHLHIGGWARTILNNEDMALLPENLYYLNLPLYQPSGGRYLSAAAAKFLPKGLFKLDINWSQPTWFSPSNFEQFASSQ